MTDQSAEKLTPQISFDNVLNGRAEREGRPGQWRVVRTPEGILYEVFGQEQPLGETKARELSRDARTAAADRVRKAVDALNDVVLAAKDQGVFCDFTVVDYGSFVGNTQIVTVTCNTRI